MIRLNGSIVAALALTFDVPKPQGVVGAAAPAKSKINRFGDIFGKATFRANMGEPNVIEKGKLKGHTRTRLADVVLEFGKTGVPFAGGALMMNTSPNGEVDFFFKWPTTGTGVYSRPVIDVKGSGTVDNPQYVDEARDLAELGEQIVASGLAFLKSEKEAGRGLNASKPTAKIGGSVNAKADDLLALGIGGK